MRAIVRGSAVGAVVGLVWGLPAGPASVAKLPTEADLVVVTLKPEAETRLGIATAPIVRKPAPRSMAMGGDVVVPPGRLAIVSAPQTGTVIVPEGGVAPEPGLPVARGKAIFTRLPLQSADRTLPRPLAGAGDVRGRPGRRRGAAEDRAGPV